MRRLTRSKMGCRILSYRFKTGRILSELRLNPAPGIRSGFSLCPIIGMQAKIPIGLRAPGFLLDSTGIDRLFLGSDLIRPCIRSEMTGLGSRKLRPG